MEDEELLKRMDDLVRLSDKYHSPRFSDFLDARQQEIIKKSGFSRGVFFGGFPDAERKIIGVFPDWQEIDYSLFPISAVKVTKKYEKEISHRNYLGTVLSLGIKREKIGDILVGDNTSYILASSDIADFIKGNMHKISGCGVFSDIVAFDEVCAFEHKFELIDAVCSSLRLDCVLSAAVGLSRSKVKTLIDTGRVCVNHFEENRVDFILSPGDLLSVRGFGRILLERLDGTTKSNRLHIILKKFL